MKDVPSANRKLSDDQAAEIRYRVGMGKLSQRRAALEYGVSKRTISGIMAGELYKHCKPAPRPVVVERTRFEVQSGRSYSHFPLRTA